MLGLKLVRLIERHSETLSHGLAERINRSERTSEFRRLAPEDVHLAATDVYRNLGEWLLQKTEADIARHFKEIAVRRAQQGISLHQLVWALTLTRENLWHFLRQEGFADTVVELHGELELHQLLDQFFDRAVYYAILGHEQSRQQAAGEDHVVRARATAASDQHTSA